MQIVKPENRQIHGIVGIQVFELKALGLSVRVDPESPDKSDRINGHVVIPELSCDLYVQNKASITAKILQLAKLTSTSDHIFLDPIRDTDWDPSHFE